MYNGLQDRVDPYFLIFQCKSLGRHLIWYSHTKEIVVENVNTMLYIESFLMFYIFSASEVQNHSSTGPRLNCDIWYISLSSCGELMLKPKLSQYIYSIWKHQYCWIKYLQPSEFKFCNPIYCWRFIEYYILHPILPYSRS